MIYLKSFGLLTGLTGICYSASPNNIIVNEKMPPNIVMITCHDLGQHLGCYGIQSVNSPNIDSLSAKGIMFKNFYSTSAVSSPARASLFTGRYPQSNGMMGLTHAPWWWSLNEGEKHMAELLKSKNYLTVLIGLNHVGEPAKLGFEHHLSKRCKAEESVHEAIKFLEMQSKKESPFFLQIGFNEVHSPYKQEPDSSKGLFVPGYLKSTPKINNELIKFQGDIKYMDTCVGKIINAVEKSKIAENTIIVFISDHGIGFPGAKWSVRKAGIEVPVIIYQPNSIFSGGKIFNELMSNVDVLPTLFEYCGLSVPDNIEGLSFKKFIAGETEQVPRDFIFGQYTADMKRDNQARTIISEKYQLIRYFDAGRTVVFPIDADPSLFAAHLEREKTSGVRPFFELFDLENDPFELEDIGTNKQYQDVVKTLSEKLLVWMKSVKDPLLEGPLSTPYYEKSIENFYQSTE